MRDNLQKLFTLYEMDTEEDEAAYHVYVDPVQGNPTVVIVCADCGNEIPILSGHPMCQEFWHGMTAVISAMEKSVKSYREMTKGN